ncbi:cytochrome c oxidase subunit 6C-like [Dendroctonus ponderosae]
MSAAEVTKPLPRPQLRGLLRSSIKRNLISVAITITTAAVLMKFVHNDGRKTAYAEFYKNYDIDKEFERMRKKGLFDSCPSD